MPLEVGDHAPDFTLPTGADETVTLSEVLEECDYAVVVFFPAVWSRPCSNEASVINAVYDEIRRLGGCVLGVAPDNHPSTRAWSEELGLHFPVGADFEPKGKVSHAFGVRHDAGVCERAQFIVDRQMTIRLAYVAPVDTSPGAQPILKALEELSAGG